MTSQINTGGFLKITNYELRITNLRFSSAFIRVNLWLILLFSLTLTASAQAISGIVTDSNDAPIASAEVSLSDKTRIVAQTVTDAEGKFSFAQSVGQNLRLVVKASGFTDFSRILSANSNEVLKITLLPAAVGGDVTISITQSETRLSETPASVVVFSRETLEQTAAQNIDDALRQIPGFNLFRRSSSKTTNPTAQGANLRGLSGSGAARTAVQFDGASLNDAFGGWTYWTRIPKSAIEQIETLRGGASQFFGDAALSGAVNLRLERFGFARRFSHTRLYSDRRKRTRKRRFKCQQPLSKFIFDARKTLQRKLPHLCSRQLFCRTARQRNCFND
jgi:outer membrane receptor protein involved in Fe transport